MKTMSAHLKPSDFVAQLRMERQRHKGAFLLFEGSNDILRFRKFFDEKACSFVNCWGKGNVVDTIDLEENAGHEDVLGFVDADFDRVISGHQDCDNIIHSKHHDFDLDVCTTGAADRYLSEVAEGQKLQAAGGCKTAVAALMSALKPLSAMRYANERHQLGYSFKELSLANFFDGAVINVDQMIESVSTGRFQSMGHKATLREHVDRYAAAELDLGQLTNGHDLMAALGVALRDKLGNRHYHQSLPWEVERHLRLTLDTCDVIELGFHEAIASWQARVANHIVLK